MVRITKKIVNDCVRKYIQEGNSPSDQPEPRDSLYFDINGVVNEFHARLLSSPKNMSESEIQTIVRKILHIAEAHSNMFKKAKIVAEDIAYAFEDFSIVS